MATQCTITRYEFRTRAKAMKLTLQHPDGREFVAYVQVKEFDS